MSNNEEQIRDSIKKLKTFIERHDDHLEIHGKDFDIGILFPNGIFISCLVEKQIITGDDIFLNNIFYIDKSIKINDAEKEYLYKPIWDMLRRKGIVVTEEDKKEEFDRKVEELDQFIHKKPEPPPSVLVNDNSNKRKMPNKIEKESKIKSFFKKSMLNLKYLKSKNSKPLYKMIKVSDTGGLRVDPVDFINSKEGKETMKKFEEYLRKQSNKRGGRK